MKRFTIDYSETYTGEITVTLDDDATEQEAIDEITQNADIYLRDIQCTDGNATVTRIEHIQD